MLVGRRECLAARRRPPAPEPPLLPVHPPHPLRSAVHRTLRHGAQYIQSITIAEPQVKHRLLRFFRRRGCWFVRRGRVRGLGVEAGLANGRRCEYDRRTARGYDDLPVGGLWQGLQPPPHPYRPYSQWYVLFSLFLQWDVILSASPHLAAYITCLVGENVGSWGLVVHVHPH